MIKGFYAAGSGMVAQVYRQQVISHNLANLTTTAYKADRLDFQSYPGLESSSPDLLLVRADGIPAGDTAMVGAGVMAEDRPFDLAQGELRPTGVELDLALHGPGFFALQTLDGVAYTRNGAFQRTAEGILTSVEGYPVLGQDGHIELGQGPVVITPEGEVLQDGQEAGRLLLVDFAPEQTISKLGYNLFVPADPGAEPTPTTSAVAQGFLETSNVDPVQSMTEMLSALRSYETSQRMAVLQDQVLSQTVTEVGKVT